MEFQGLQEAKREEDRSSRAWSEYTTNLKFTLANVVVANIMGLIGRVKRLPMASYRDFGATGSRDRRLVVGSLRPFKRVKVSLGSHVGLKRTWQFAMLARLRWNLSEQRKSALISIWQV